MHTIPVEEAVGRAVVHDMTKIEIQDGRRRKYPKFRRGHIVREEDIPELLRMGKRHILVMDPGEEKDWVFEEEAADRLARAFGGNCVRYGSPSEGKVEMYADCDGVSAIEKQAVDAVNARSGFLLATVCDGIALRRGELMAAAKIIPLFMPKDTFEQEMARFPGHFVSVRPYRHRRVSIIVTGTEIYEGKIPDAFAPLLHQKLEAFPAEVLSVTYVPDEEARIAAAILGAEAQGAEIVLITGGMSVDPDDRSPTAIRRVADDFVKHGGNALPGAMTVVAYRGEMAILGIPGGSLFSPIALSDFLLSRMMTGERLTFADIAAYGYGGIIR